MKIDLHIHTDISDGFQDIEQSLRIAKAKGLQAVAITDHDTTAGIIPSVAIGAKIGIKVIPGVEISAIDKASGVKAHILGYFINIPSNNIDKICNQILIARHEQAIWQMNKLVEHGYNIDIEQVVKQRQGHPVYKQHIMQELINKGYTNAIYSNLYRQLFKNNGICAVEIEYADVLDVVRAIKADGGIAVLAHPGYDNNYFLIEALVECGLDGIELIHEKHSLSDLKNIVRLARKHNLILTGGSDYHGELYNDLYGNLVCPKGTSNYFAEHNTQSIVFMQELVVQAGQYLQQFVANGLKDINYKEGRWDNIVTEADIELEKFVVRSIQEKFPADGFITEENTIQSDSHSTYTWIIDPIDGTTNFVSCQKDYTISIALYKNMQPYAGVVYDPISNDLYFAMVGQGAWLNGKRVKTTNRVEKLKDAVLDFSLNTVVDLRERGKNLLQLVNIMRGHRAYGCASLSICKTAIGELDGYISSKVCIWDYAAAAIFLQEMGGELIVCKHESNPDKCNMFMATATPKLLQEILISTSCRRME